MYRDLELIETYSTVLKDDVILLPTANDLGAGFAYYLCEIVVPELGRCQDRSPSNDALVAILDPFVQGLAETKNTILLKKMRNDIFHEIPEHLDTVPFSSLDIMAMAEHLFTLGTLSVDHPFHGENYLHMIFSMNSAAESLRILLLSCVVHLSTNTMLPGSISYHTCIMTCRISC